MHPPDRIRYNQIRRKCPIHFQSPRPCIAVKVRDEKQHLQRISDQTRHFLKARRAERVMHNFLTVSLKTSYFQLLPTRNALTFNFPLFQRSPLHKYLEIISSKTSITLLPSFSPVRKNASVQVQRSVRHCVNPLWYQTSTVLAGSRFNRFQPIKLKLVEI